ncbi:hypothetical protein C8R43DRAFT_956113 [Mycena crocata]|nr:hypothetical protein C8R43DRAFT_956113 [Mycena crocata]
MKEKRHSAPVVLYARYLCVYIGANTVVQRTQIVREWRGSLGAREKPGNGARERPNPYAKATEGLGERDPKAATSLSEYEKRKPARKLADLSSQAATSRQGLNYEEPMRHPTSAEFPRFKKKGSSWIVARGKFGKKIPLLQKGLKSDNLRLQHFWKVKKGLGKLSVRRTSLHLCRTDLQGGDFQKYSAEQVEHAPKIAKKGELAARVFTKAKPSSFKFFCNDDTLYRRNVRRMARVAGVDCTAPGCFRFGCIFPPVPPIQSLSSGPVLETVQVIFFSVSSYSRFVKLFGVLQTNLICCNCSAHFFANRIIKLTKGRGKFSLKAFGIYVILALAFIEILAGIAQVAWTYQIRSFLKLDRTKITTTIQSGASFACDVLITTYLCLFLKNQKGEMMKTNHMVDALIYDAINRGTLTAMSSFVTLVLFLVLPNTFWFFLGLAPSSKLYMNSMLATLNTRQRIRNKIDAGDKGWNSIGNSIPLSTLQIGNKDASGQSQSIPSIAAVDLETGSVDMCRKREEYPTSGV